MPSMQPLQPSQVDATARLLADAMEVDPAYRHLFPDDGERRTGLRRLFAGSLGTHLPHGCTFVAVDAGRVVATATLRPPGGVPVSAWTMIRRGLLPFVFAHGLSAVRRMLWLKRQYDALEAELARGERHFHLHMMAVAPDRQGQGVGSALLGHVLEAGGARGSEHPCVLTTHLPQNVTFYRRAGFEVAWEQTVRPPGEPPYGVWGMRRAG